MSYASHLKKKTGHDWEETNPLYVNYKLQTSPMKFFCVFTPDDIYRNPNPRFYIPKECRDSHDPEYFLNKFLNGKSDFVKYQPPIQINLERIAQRPFTAGAIPLIYVGTLSFTGTLTFNPIGSKSALTLENTGISFTHAINGLMSSYEVGLGYDSSGIEISVNSSITGPLGDKSTVSVTQNSFCITHEPRPVRWQYQGWDIIGNVGFVVEGTRKNDSATPMAAPAPSRNSTKTILGDTFLIGIDADVLASACIIFTEGWCAPAAVPLMVVP